MSEPEKIKSRESYLNDLNDVVDAFEHLRETCKEHRKFDWRGFQEGYVRAIEPPNRKEAAQRFITALKKALELP